jgi:hypothetical protein
MPRSLDRAFAAFHVTLGVVILVESLRTALQALRGGGGHALLLLASVEAIGAALFLWPGTVVVGAWAMLATFAVAFSVHALRGEFHLGLLVYAAGTILVLARRRAVAAEPSRA